MRRHPTLSHHLKIPKPLLARLNGLLPRLIASERVRVAEIRFSHQQVARLKEVSDLENRVAIAMVPEIVNGKWVVEDKGAEEIQEYRVVANFLRHDDVGIVCGWRVEKL